MVSIVYIFFTSNKKIDSLECSFCEKEIETIEPFFWESGFIQGLLNDFTVHCCRNSHTYICRISGEF